MKMVTLISSRAVSRLTLTIALCVLGISPAGAMADRSIVRHTGVSKLDKTFAIEATHGLMRDAALATLAEHRASTKQVRTFARKIEDQRSRAHARLRRLAKETHLRLPERLDWYQRDQIQKLGSLTGREFDKQFLRYIADTKHTRFYQFELNSGAMCVYPPVRTFAEEQLRILRDDMRQARQLLQNYL